MYNFRFYQNILVLFKRILLFWNIGGNLNYHKQYINKLKLKLSLIKFYNLAIINGNRNYRFFLIYFSNNVLCLLDVNGRIFFILLIKQFEKFPLRPCIDMTSYSVPTLGVAASSVQSIHGYCLTPITRLTKELSTLDIVIIICCWLQYRILTRKIKLFQTYIYNTKKNLYCK